MTAEEMFALLLEIARKSMYIEAQSRRIAELEAQLAAPKESKEV